MSRELRWARDGPSQRAPETSVERGNFSPKRKTGCPGQDLCLLWGVCQRRSPEGAKQEARAHTGAAQEHPSRGSKPARSHQDRRRPCRRFAGMARSYKEVRRWAVREQARSYTGSRCIPRRSGPCPRIPTRRNGRSPGDTNLHCPSAGTRQARDRGHGPLLHGATASMPGIFPVEDPLGQLVGDACRRQVIGLGVGIDLGQPLGDAREVGGDGR